MFPLQGITVGHPATKQMRLNHAMLASSYVALSIHQKVSFLYPPRIGSAQPRRRYQLGAYHATLFDTIESAGPFQYLYVLVVFGEDGAPLLFVASETSEVPPLLGPAPPFLGLFAADGHRNLGSDGRWTDMEQFLAGALRLARNELHAAEKAVLLRQEG
jgi:hypothetical protein